jgi:hypothetical protein
MNAMKGLKKLVDSLSILDYSFFYYTVKANT